jgi:hypothetical protein
VQTRTHIQNKLTRRPAVRVCTRTNKRASTRTASHAHTHTHTHRQPHACACRYTRTAQGTHAHRPAGICGVAEPTVARARRSAGSCVAASATFGTSRPKVGMHVCACTWELMCMGRRLGLCGHGGKHPAITTIPRLQLRTAAADGADYTQHSPRRPCFTVWGAALRILKNPYTMLIWIVCCRTRVAAQTFGTPSVRI